MLRTPFLLTLLCIYIDKHGVSFDGSISRSTLYNSATSMLLIRREEAHGTGRRQNTLEELEDVLRRVAAAAFERSRGLFSLPELELWGFASELPEIGKVLEEIETLSGIVRHLSDRDYGFAHLSLQEYYVARHYQIVGHDAAMMVRSLRYWEVLRFLASLLNQSDLPDFFNKLLASPEPTQQWRAAVAIANALLEASDYIFKQYAAQIFAFVSQHIMIMKDDVSSVGEMLEVLSGLIARDREGVLDREFSLFWKGDVASAIFGTKMIIGAQRSAVRDELVPQSSILIEKLLEASLSMQIRLIDIVADGGAAFCNDILVHLLSTPSAAYALDTLARVSFAERLSLRELIWTPILSALVDTVPPAPRELNADGFGLRFKLARDVEPGTDPAAEALADYILLNVRAMGLGEKEIYNSATGTSHPIDQQLIDSVLPIINAVSGDHGRVPGVEKILTDLAVQAISGNRFLVIEETILSSVLAEFRRGSLRAVVPEGFFRVEYWSDSTSIDTQPQVQHGIVVNDEIWFPGMDHGAILRAVLSAVTGYFWPDLLALLNQNTTTAVRECLLSGFSHGCSIWVLRASRYLIPIESYRRRVEFELRSELQQPGHVRLLSDMIERICEKYFLSNFDQAVCVFREMYENDWNEIMSHGKVVDTLFRWALQNNRGSHDLLTRGWEICVGDGADLMPDDPVWEIIFRHPKILQM
jgi:hypothetical protein